MRLDSTKQRDHKNGKKTIQEKTEQTRMGHRWEVDMPWDLALLNSNRVWEAKILDLKAVEI